MRLDDMQLAIRDQYRKYMMTELETVTPSMERGEVLPFPLMRKMIHDLGLGPDSQAGTVDEDPELRALAAWARIQLIVEIARVNPGFGMSWGVSVGLCAGNIRRSGTPEQQARYLPALLGGEKVGCWCLTEPGAGSDAFRSMRTTAKRDGDHFVLTGSKTFITNAPHGDVFLVYAKDAADGSIQAFIVDRETEGVSTGEPFKKMGMRSSPTGEVFFDGVRVPAANQLGGGVRDRDHVRKSLAGERIGMAVMGYGIAERCFEIARDYAKERVQGGRPIGQYQLVQSRLARMYVALCNTRRIAYDADEELSALDACAGKLYVAEMGTFVATEAIHILGGYGYLEEHTVERLARDAKLLELGGGTTEIQILTIARHILAE